MSKRVATREDLIRDAVALVDRAEFVGDSLPPVVIGFRQDNSVSIYFGEQPVYQFNSEGQLRRVYLDGILKAEKGRLVRWEKTYRDNQVQMIARPLQPLEQTELLEVMQSELRALRDGIANHSFRAARQVSQKGSDAVTRSVDWLSNLPHPIQVAESPGVR